MLFLKYIFSLFNDRRIKRQNCVIIGVIRKWDATVNLSFWFHIRVFKIEHGRVEGWEEPERGAAFD